MPAYTAYNAAMATTAATAKVTTGTSIKTMLQIATPSTRQIQLISWGYSVDAPPATTGTGVIELIDTDVAATSGTAHGAAGVQPVNPGQAASLMTLGTGATGFTFTVEGTTTASRLLDFCDIAGVSNGAWPTKYVHQWMPDERPTIAVSRFLRVRVTFSAAVNMNCWVRWDE